MQHPIYLHLRIWYSRVLLANGAPVVIRGCVYFLTTANTTHYIQPTAWYDLTTETEVQLGFNDGYSSLTRLGAKIFDNSISGGASLIRSRINAANGNQVISIGASSTGDFVDGSGEDVISGDDMYCVAFVPGAANWYD